MTGNGCPLCRMPMKAAGRLVAAIDEARQHFVFSVCRPCADRLDRLPNRLQRKQLNLAIAALARHPERYLPPLFFESGDAASLYCRLEAERLSSTIH